VGRKGSQLVFRKLVMFYMFHENQTGQAIAWFNHNLIRGFSLSFTKLARPSFSILFSAFCHYNILFCRHFDCVAISNVFFFSSSSLKVVLMPFSLICIFLVWKCWSLDTHLSVLNAINAWISCHNHSYWLYFDSAGSLSLAEDSQNYISVL